MISIFKSRNDLDFLFCRLRQKKTTYLSWCVDFSQKDGLFHFMDASELYQRYGARNACATNGRAAFRVLHDIQKGTITLTGAIVASSGASNAEELHVMQLRIRMLLDGMLSCTRISQEVWEKRHGRRAAHLKVEAGDVWRAAAGSRLMRELLNRPYDINDGYAVMASLAKQGSNQLFRERIEVSDVQFEIAWSAYSRLAETYYINGQHLYTTDTNYVGSGSQDVQSGDLLCILFGCKLPLVLRLGHDGSYKLIDYVYTDGIMNGEFLEDEAGYTEVNFVLS
ncbi:hypothetical protein BKA64DRAFT_253290 [Cadophora sp. MPI-SDFR-AT-0126]|nr:hypothetical protein BKA64DRAFT_253290 [Leotiomycetes sp. MPI-SDFR-AT-0126]